MDHEMEEKSRGPLDWAENGPDNRLSGDSRVGKQLFRGLCEPVCGKKTHSTRVNRRPMKKGTRKCLFGCQILWLRLHADYLADYLAVHLYAPFTAGLLSRFTPGSVERSVVGAFCSASRWSLIVSGSALRSGSVSVGMPVGPAGARWASAARWARAAGAMEGPDAPGAAGARGVWVWAWAPRVIRPTRAKTAACRMTTPKKGGFSTVKILSPHCDCIRRPLCRREPLKGVRSNPHQGTVPLKQDTMRTPFSRAFDSAVTDASL